MKTMSRNIALVGMIASLYATLTILLAPISYGPIQVRISEALTVLPYLFPQAIPALFLGCAIANLYGGYGLLDIIGGSLLTLLAASATYALRRLRLPWVAPLPPVLFNAFGVALILHVQIRVPYWFSVGYIFLGQFVACYVLGLPLLYVLLRRHSRIGLK